MWWQTLYKTDAPQELESAEYYQPRVEMKNIAGKWFFFVQETHGWYKDDVKEVVHKTYTLEPEEGFSTHQGAQIRYEQQLAHRASGGFVHSFSVDPFSESGIAYRKLG
jgi:hypothetical protein